MSTSFITPGHVRVFQMLRSPLYDNLNLASCRINGEPGVAIVLVDEAEEGKVAVMPLFVAITQGMEIVFEGEERSSGGGGPRRGFATNKTMTEPSPTAS